MAVDENQVLIGHLKADVNSSLVRNFVEPAHWHTT
jgi:hypothetical protein